jgi:hypothetical protein
MLGSMTKYFPMRGMKEASTRQEMIEGQIKIDTILAQMGGQNGVHITNCIMGAKSQSGMPEEIVARFNNTARWSVVWREQKCARGLRLEFASAFCCWLEASMRGIQ